MKTTLVWMGLLLISISSCAESTRRDGNWWLQQDTSNKLAYMVGFLDGTQLGRDFSYWNFAHEDRKQDCLGPINDSYEKYRKQYLSDVTNDQISDGLDVFYKDYRNRTIRIPRAVWIVLRTIAGSSQKEIDDLTENSRKSASSQ